MEPLQPMKGRGAAVSPANRFESVRAETDFEQVEREEEALAGARRTEFLPDASNSIIMENNSPDVGFRFSVNAYRGCEHGCAYCYARPTHEWLGMNAGLDFETRILVKHDAPRLLREALSKPKWKGDVLSMSGVTDCYQPIERELKLTRGLLEVMLEARQPVGIVTKNALVTRDLDLLSQMAEMRIVHVFISLTTLDTELARTLEPRTSSPEARLRAIRDLSAAGVPVGVMLAPIIPGLTDAEIPALLAAANEAGARTAGYVPVRLPLAVAPIFQAWLEAHAPLKRARVEGLIRDMRGGRLNDSNFGSRMRGEGAYAEQMAQTFKVFAAKHGLDGRLPEIDHSLFRCPRDACGQKTLWEE